VTLSLQRCLILAVLVFLFITGVGSALAENPETKSNNQTATFSAKHVLGLPNTHENTSGALDVQSGSLRFGNKKQEVTFLPIVSIQAILLSQEDKQVGGVPMMLGKAAVPFSGGRVVSLFSHKKYDHIALIYRDDNGAVHGAIFELPTGQGQKLRELLVAQGARIGPQNSANGSVEPEVSDGSK
jgi:hypothetical protein